MKERDNNVTIGFKLSINNSIDENSNPDSPKPPAKLNTLTLPEEDYFLIINFLPHKR